MYVIVPDYRLLNNLPISTAYFEVIYRLRFEWRLMVLSAPDGSSLNGESGNRKREVLNVRAMVWAESVRERGLHLTRFGRSGSWFLHRPRRWGKGRGYGACGERSATMLFSLSALTKSFFATGEGRLLMVWPTQGSQ